MNIILKMLNVSNGIPVIRRGDINWDLLDGVLNVVASSSWEKEKIEIGLLDVRKLCTCTTKLFIFKNFRRKNGMYEKK